MNSNSFISLKMGPKILFLHPLSQLKQISSSIKKRTNNPNDNKRNMFNFDVIPKFIFNNAMKQDLSKKLLNKKKIFSNIKNTYFSKNHPDFSGDLKNIENDINFLHESIDKGYNNDYLKFGEMINIINSNKLNDKKQLIQKMNINEYKKNNNEMKKEIINSISLNKELFIQKINLNKKNPKLNQMSKSRAFTDSNKDLINNNNIDNNKNINTNTNKNANINKNINNKNNITNDNNYNTEPNLKENMNKIIPISEEKIQLFKIFVGNSKLSNKIILSYFDSYNPKVKIAGEKYFKSKYGCELITLKYIYPANPPGSIYHKFDFISEIKELFIAAENDWPSLINPKLFLENGKEIINNKKIKCIGALNLNNNSVIKVFR